MRFIKLTLLSILLLSVLFVSGCTKNNAIVIASKPDVEPYILANMLKFIIEKNTDYEVKLKLGIGGGSANIQKAILRGDVDLYPEYVATAVLFILHNDKIPQEEMYDFAKKEYKKRFNLAWRGKYGFDNSFSLAVTDDVYKQGIRTYSDLAKHSGKLVFGSEYDFFERPDGLQGLTQVYNFKFKDHKGIEMGLKYQALATKKVDVINSFTTDAELKLNKYHVLQDDKHFFRRYDAATVVRMETLKKYPKLAGVLDKMNGLISNKDMQDMNYKVKILHKSSEQVAKEFLQSKKLL